MPSTNNFIRFALVLLIGLLVCRSTGQQIYTKGLLEADKLFIKKDYRSAALLYEQYLEKYPKDFFASRQAALCFDFLNDHYSACENWPAVIESSESTEYDLFRYAQCLLQNNREKEAKRIFPILARSADPNYAAWARANLTPSQFYLDSAEYEVRFVDGLNTQYSESSPIIQNGRIFYCTAAELPMRAYTPLEQKNLQHLSVQTMMDTLRFKTPEVLERFNRFEVFGQVSFSADGLEMYFTKPVSNEEAGVKSPFKFSRYQLFVLKVATLNEKEPQISPFPFNNSLYNFMHPCLSADGELLFFSSDMKGTSGGCDIYVSRKINGEWTAPINMGPKVNSIGNDLYPQVKSNGNLIFSSDGWAGLGGLDLFECKLNDGVLEQAKNLGYPLNSRYDDFGLVFFGLRAGFFSSNRYEGLSDDLYFFKYKD